MFKKNIVIASRSLKKDVSYTITNLVGLAIGITCCLLILSFVKYELSFDQFHTKKDHIYRVNYAYNNRYLLTLSWRTDRSSRFTKANRTGNFPSASVGWNIGEEPFMKNYP